MAHAQVEVDPEFAQMKKGLAIFQIHDINSIIIFHLNHKTKICPCHGGYLVNCVNFDVSIKRYELNAGRIL